MAGNDLKTIVVNGTTVCYDPNSVKINKDMPGIVTARLSNGAILNFGDQTGANCVPKITIEQYNDIPTVYMTGIKGANYRGANMKADQVYMNTCEGCTIDIKDGFTNDVVEDNSEPGKNTIRHDNGDRLYRDRY